ncbi:hypothetical protein Tco_0161170, partial [Tanacetum coccineum]
MSYLSLSSHLSLGLPLLLEPPTNKDSTLLTGVVCGLLLRCPNHLNLPSLILSIIESTSCSALKTPSGIMSTMDLVGEASTSVASLYVEDYDEEDTDEALGSVVAIPKLKT